MTDIHKIQGRLNYLFIEKFRNYKGGLNLSVPLIPKISADYLRTRVVVVGQETNTWYRRGDDDLLNLFVKNIDDVEKTCLESRYNHFIRNTAAKYGGMFWAFQRQLYDRGVLKGRMVNDGTLSHCWINIFSVESCLNKDDDNGRPTKNKNLGREIMNLQGNLLYEILCVLHPKLIVFLTGKSLDHYLINNGLNSTNCDFKRIDKSGILDDGNLAEVVIKEVKHPLYGTKIIRSYHPTYFMGKINRFTSLQKKLNSNNWKGTNAKYYNQILFEALLKSPP